MIVRLLYHTISGSYMNTSKVVKNTRYLVLNLLRKDVLLLTFCFLTLRCSCWYIIRAKDWKRTELEWPYQVSLWLELLPSYSVNDIWFYYFDSIRIIHKKTQEACTLRITICGQIKSNRVYHFHFKLIPSWAFLTFFQGSKGRMKYI